MMNKNELLKFVEDNKVMKKDEFEQLFDNTFEEMKRRKLPEDQLELYTVARVQASLKKRIRSAQQTFEAIFLGNMGTTDFGARKKYDTILEKWNKASLEDRQVMIKNHEISPQGEPLYTTPAWRIGKKITLNSLTEQFLILVRRDNTEDWRKAQLSITKNVGKIPPYFKLTQIQATFNEKKSSESDMLFLSSDSLTFQLMEDRDIDFKDYALKYFKEGCCDLLSLEDWYEKHKEKQNNIVIVKGNVSKISVFDNRTLVELDDPAFGLSNEAKVVSCWISNNVPLYCDDMAMGVFAIGRPYMHKNKDDSTNIAITLHGLFVPEDFRILPPEKIRDDKIVEKIVEKNKKGPW